MRVEGGEKEIISHHFGNLKFFMKCIPRLQTIVNEICVKKMKCSFQNDWCYFNLLMMRGKALYCVLVEWENLISTVYFILIILENTKLRRKNCYHIMFSSFSAQIKDSLSICKNIASKFHQVPLSPSRAHSGWLKFKNTFGCPTIQNFICRKLILK